MTAFISEDKKKNPAAQMLTFSESSSLSPLLLCFLQALCCFKMTDDN